MKIEITKNVSEALLEDEAKKTENDIPVLIPNICRRCCLRVSVNKSRLWKSTGHENKEDFYDQFKHSQYCPDSFNMLEDDISSLTYKLRSIPENTCYLCAGILQDKTIEQLMTCCKELLSQYECAGSVGLTCSNVYLLNIRSYMCGVGKLHLQIKTVFKWLMADELTKLLGVPQVAGNASKTDDQDLMVNVDIRLDNDEYMWTARPPVSWDVYSFSQGHFKSARLDEALAKSSYEEIRKYLKLPGRAIQYSISVAASTTFVGGRYTKNARDISQTPWKQQDGLLISGNVEDILTKPLKQAFGADEAKMHSAGREDIDVRMLGSGRPFYVQLTNVRKFPTQVILDAVQKEINESSPHVKCYKLTPVTKAETELVKRGQEDKQKEYRCIIKAENVVTDDMIDKLNNVINLDLDQKTPIRVLHRRTTLTRTKRIIKVDARLLNRQEVEVCTGGDLDLATSLLNRLFVADVVSGAGTYIKEFVHGDFNRTVPNVGSIIGNRCDMLQLDVVNLPMVWPPEKDLKGDN